MDLGQTSAEQDSLRTLNFADAHVEAWHEGPSDPYSTATGGAFFSEGSFTLTRSHLTAPWISFWMRRLDVIPSDWWTTGCMVWDAEDTHDPTSR